MLCNGSLMRGKMQNLYSKRGVFCFSYFLFWLYLHLPAPSSGIRWLSLHNTSTNWTEEGACAEARRAGSLWEAQARACRRQPTAMPHVARAAGLARDACLAAHAKERWNCSSVTLAPNFTPDLLTAASVADPASLEVETTATCEGASVSTQVTSQTRALPSDHGTREQAYVYAMSAAALTWAVSRACAAGALPACSCAAPPRAPPRPSRAADTLPHQPQLRFKWGGCGDNFKWADRFAKAFLDAHEIDIRSGKIEKAPAPPQPSQPLEPTTSPPYVILVDDQPAADNVTLPQERKKGRKERGRKRVPREPARRARPKRKRYRFEDRTSFMRNIEYRMAADDPRFDPQVDLDTRLGRLRTLIASANLANLKFGRKAVSAGMYTKCTCHGVSGSCSVRTCWRTLPPLASISAELAAAATRAAALKLRATPRRQRVPRLRYVTPSPDYCEPDPTAGSLGTHGRWCNASRGDGPGTCARLCCGRGRRVERSVRLERCRCRYHWCCRVDCQLCRTTTEEHYCN